MPATPVSKPPPPKPVFKQLPPKASPAPAKATKTFAVTKLTGSGEGEKIIIYAPSGMGKTTLATMAPNPIFIPIDDGSRKIRNPKTGQPVQALTGVETFQDLRDALHQGNLFPKGSTLVLDTASRAEVLAEQYVFDHIKIGKTQVADNMEDYGYGKGYKHLSDTMRLLLTDFEPLVRNGVNILLLCQQSQAKVANLEGIDYVQDGPKLFQNTQVSIRAEWNEWADHTFRIGFPDLTVIKSGNPLATKGRAAGTTNRGIYTQGELYFLAKNRMNGKLPPIISFATPDDDSLWQYVFGEADFRKEQQSE